MRHGEIDAQWHGKIYGSLDVPLSERGKSETRAAVAALHGVPLAAVVSSGLSRTEYAASALRVQRGLPRRDDPALRELERGEWAGLPLTELEARSPGAWRAWMEAPGRTRPPGGESLEDLAERVVPRVGHGAEVHAHQPIALKAQLSLIRVLVCLSLGLNRDRAPFLDVRTGDLSLLAWPLPVQCARPRLVGFALDRRRGDSGL